MDDLRNTAALQTFIQNLQGIISRLANNSSNCKTWCITISAAILIFVLEKGQFFAVSIGFMPIIMFFFLDAYYLSLERDFRNLYNEFVEKLNKNELAPEEIFVINPARGTKHRITSLGSSIKSFSVWPFYLILAIALLICLIIIGA